MISFNAERVGMPHLDFRRIGVWLADVALAHHKNVGRINYLFCDDEEILKVNKEFLQHDYYTDIITFDYSFKNKISGDIYISLDTVKSNSEELNAKYEEELLRVIAHGLLHLCGIDDKGPGEREIMEEEENKALSLYSSLL